MTQLQDKPRDPQPKAAITKRDAKAEALADRELTDAELDGIAAGVKGGTPPDPPQKKPGPG